MSHGHLHVPPPMHLAAFDSGQGNLKETLADFELPQS
eukprot:CAMPEP_0179414836 /NCGR_PEP_ID=MMETSP0799-20121207/5901_1 /TAXON_ID=46947 /ORGANISM="Geminigera cryophila, Strain CCMP2564" /LENGTH=36 /DNA_ID= /DNA_START= /DNA_END= /DNA_ORIENTATION=